MLITGVAGTALQPSSENVYPRYETCEFCAELGQLDPLYHYEMAEDNFLTSYLLIETSRAQTVSPLRQQVVSLETQCSAIES